MKIEAQEVVGTQFRDVQAGITFLYSGSDYVKTHTFKGDSLHTNALRLEDGSHECFQDVTYITLTPNSKFVRGI